MKRLIPKIFVTVLVALGVYLFLYYGEEQKLPRLLENFDTFSGVILATGLIAFVFEKIGAWLNKNISWKSTFGKRYFAGFSLYLMVIYTVAFVFLVVFNFIEKQNFEVGAFLSTHADLIYKFLLITLLLVILYTLIDLAVFAYHQYAFGHINSIKTEREILNHKYSALKKQLSPHFLFNSLNTASSLLYRDEVVAEKYIRTLAKSYDTILETTTENLVELEKELEIVNAYKYLMEIRYEKALKIEVNIPQNHKSILLPPLSLQLLLENAVKHNLISNQKPLYVEVYCDDNEYLTVANNVNPKGVYIKSNEGLIENPEHKSTGIGLKNIKSRYAFFTNKPVLIEKHEYFKVQVPIINSTDNIQLN